MCSAIQEKNLQKLAGRLGNILESVTQKEYPEILEIKKQMLSFGALGALMSGSGPTVFGLFDDKKAAQKAFYSFDVCILWFVARARWGHFLFVLFSLPFCFNYLLVCRSGRDGPILFDRQKGSKNLVKGCRYLPPFDYTPNSV